MNKLILDLCIGNHDLFMRRRKPGKAKIFLYVIQNFSNVRCCFNLQKKIAKKPRLLIIGSIVFLNCFKIFFHAQFV